MSSITEVSISRKRGLSVPSRRSRRPSISGMPDARDLLDVEAEVDQIAPRDVAAGERRARRCASARKVMRSEPHALQAQLEIDLVHGVELAARWAARLVDGFVDGTRA